MPIRLQDHPGYGNRVMDMIKRGQPKLPDYSSYIPDAQKRYMEMIYGPGGSKGYVSSQVRGAASAFQPYYNQMSKQGASSVAARGGAGGGGGDYLLSDLQGQKTGALTQAASKAESDVAQTGLQAIGMGQNEAFQMSADEFRRLQLEFQKAMLRWQKKQAGEDNKFGFLSDILGAGATVGGYLLGGPAGGAAGRYITR